MVRLAYYCSGHGYGHATRVSAFASALLSLEDDLKPEIYIVSSAPLNVFSECIRYGAVYRCADVDPIIVQPLAYKVDRWQSVKVLKAFLSEKDVKLADEMKWLVENRIHCVLSDAAFLACEAATKACIPSILVTNFTFDSVYSYLGSETTDSAPGLPHTSLQVPSSLVLVRDTVEDAPVPDDILAPLVSQLLSGYRHADVLLLLPGFIPIPSFSRSIPLPAPGWVDPTTNRFRPEIESVLLEFPSNETTLSPSIPFPTHTPYSGLHDGSAAYVSNRKPTRAVKRAPLLVRPASTHVYTPQGRSNLLSSIGIPENLHDPSRTQILVVSFGGQKIRRPHGGKSPSRTPSPMPPDVKDTTNDTAYGSITRHGVASRPEDSIESIRYPRHDDTHAPSNSLSRPSTKIFVPGAPAPALNPTSPRLPNNSPELPDFQIYRSDAHADIASSASLPPPSLGPAQGEDEPSLLPSPSWIAIICGVSPNWSVSGEEEEDLPPGFYVAPPNVYMPDLTYVADVLMGKLGYGTVSESISYSTPFVYVPRPLFVEEHGLRLFLEAEGIGVELSHAEYEQGSWARKVEEAYLKGKKRPRTHHGQNTQEVRELAQWVIESVKQWSL